MTKEKAADPLKEEMEDPEDQKLAEPEMEKKAEKKKKGTLICRFMIKGEDRIYKPGDVYKGKNAKHLLSRKAIYREE